jgi:prolipoprotein diacylglyceryltransferase
MIGLILAFRKCNTLAQVLTILQACILASIAAIVSGRLGFILLQFDYFQDHLNESINLLQAPGLSEHTALLAGWWMGWRYLRLRQPDQFWDLGRIMLLIGVGAALGCIEAGCGYGIEVWPTDHALAWAISVDWPDAYTVSNPRLPTQIILALWLLASLVITWQSTSSLQFQHPLRQSPNLLLMCFAIGDFVIQFLRADAIPIFAGLRLSQWLDLGLGLYARFMWQKWSHKHSRS